MLRLSVIHVSFLDGNYSLAESQTLEFKDAQNGLPNDVWETYSAFANTEGGEIVLGVHEDADTREFSLTGVDDPPRLTDDFWNTVRNPTKISRDVTLADGATTVSRDGKSFVVITVPRAERDEKPVSVWDRKARGFVAWVRRGAGDYRASDADLKLMAYDSSPSADRRPLDRFSTGALCVETVRRYRALFTARRPSSPWNDEGDEDFLFHLGAMAKGRDGRPHPTMAGLVAFGKEFEITDCLPHFLLDYRDESSGLDRWDDRLVSTDSDQWSGNAIDFYLGVTQRLQRRFPAPFSTDEMGTGHGSRNPITEAANEAVTNALVHAHYGDSATVRVVLHADRLEVTNPGSMLVDRDVAIVGGVSEARNPALMRIFGFIGAGDRAGSGLCKIWSTWQRFYDATPTLEETHSPSGVRIALPMTAPHTPHKVQEAPDSLIGILSAHPDGLTPREVGSLAGLGERSAQRALKDLEESDARVSRERRGHGWLYRFGG